MGLFTTFIFITQHTGNISSNFENMTINIGDITLLDEAGKGSLRNFSSSGIDRIDYNAFLAEVGSCVHA